MSRHTATFTFDVPEGYKWTGEYRHVKYEEMYERDGEAHQWTHELDSLNKYFILRKIEPEKPQFRCFEIVWGKFPMIHCKEHRICADIPAEMGRLVDGYRIVGFTSTSSSPHNYATVSCTLASNYLIKHTHAVGVLDEE